MRLSTASEIVVGTLSNAFAKSTAAPTSSSPLSMAVSMATPILAGTSLTWCRCIQDSCRAMHCRARVAAQILCAIGITDIGGWPSGSDPSPLGVKVTAAQDRSVGQRPVFSTNPKKETNSSMTSSGKSMIPSGLQLSNPSAPEAFNFPMVVSASFGLIGAQELLDHWIFGPRTSQGNAWRRFHDGLSWCFAKIGSHASRSILSISARSPVKLPSGLRRTDRGGSRSGLTCLKIRVGSRRSSASVRSSYFRMRLRLSEISLCVHVLTQAGP